MIPTYFLSLDSNMARSDGQDIMSLPLLTCSTDHLGGVGVPWSCDFP